MPPNEERYEEHTDHQLIEALDESHREIARLQRELLRQVAEADRRAIWRRSGARDFAHWLAIRHGISQWKARRWVGAAHALGI